MLPALSHSPQPLSVVHIASGDLWAGAEVQLYTLLCQLRTLEGVNPSAILLNRGELQERLEHAGIAVTVLPESSMSPLALYRGIHGHLARQRPDLVHTHRIKENVLGGLAAWRLGIPSLRTVHGASEHRPQGLRQLHKQVQYRLDEWVGKRLQYRLIAVTEELRGKLALTYPPQKLVTIENGLDINSVRTAAQPPAPIREPAPDAWHVGIVGRLEPVKRVDLLLDTAAALANDGQAWQFHILGDGGLRPRLEAQALGLNNVHFHGHRRDIPACLAALDALVMCSDHEGLPMTLLEALAVGIPVVAHDVGGLHLVLQGEAGGLLVGDHNPAGYAGALQSLRALSSEARQALVTRGQARLQQHYTAQANAQRVTDLYRACVGEAGDS